MSLTFWWWGEDEAPGLGSWLERVARRFEDDRDVPVDLRLLRHDEVLPGFPAAVAAGRAPDLHFFWNGIYVIENAWAGRLLPLDDLLEEHELAAFGGGPQSMWRGKTYRAAWYVIPVCWVANRRVLEAAGVEALPRTWPELVEACKRARAAGFRPITAGDGEADFSVWWLTHFLTQCVGEPVDAVRLVFDSLDWRARPFRTAWELLETARDSEMLDEEGLSLTLWEGLQRFNEGRSAFTVASGPMFSTCRRALGDGATAFVAPSAETGPLAGLPIVDTQGVGVSASSEDPRLAAALVASLHGAAERDALWRDVRLFPADRRWEGPADPDGDYLQIWRWYADGPSAPYLPNLMPLDLHYALAAEIGQAVLAGRISGAEAGAQAQQRSREWVAADAERAETYREWAEAAGRSDQALEDVSWAG
jgi:ABC-type glycerol-3-phosphate transport system substrate-binding protein